MANQIKKGTIQQKVAGAIYDVMVKTNTANVIGVDGKTLEAKITEIVANIDTKQTAEQVMTTVSAEVAKIVGDAPAALNTLKEISLALNQDPDFYKTINTLISQKADTTFVNQEVGKVDAKVTNLETRVGTLSATDIATTSDKQFVSATEKAEIAKVALKARILSGVGEAPVDMTENDLYIKLAE